MELALVFLAKWHRITLPPPKMLYSLKKKLNNI